MFVKMFLLQTTKINVIVRGQSLYKSSKCASSCFILHDVLVGNQLQVKTVSDGLVVVQNHEVIEPRLSHCAP